jgi:hypothetical protein
VDIDGIHVFLVDCLKHVLIVRVLIGIKKKGKGVINESVLCEM